MKPFTNKKGDSYLFVELLDDAIAPTLYITNKTFINYHIKCGEKKSFWKQENILLPSGKFKIIGLAKDVSEEVAESIVDREIERHPELKLYIDYTEESTRYAYLLKKATESFHSLLQSLGLKTDYTLILRKDD